MTPELKKVADRYGYNTQSRILIEEMAELIQAINKLWRKDMKCHNELHDSIFEIPFPSKTYLNVAEEIADVEICLEQIKYLLHCEEYVEDYKKEKIERTINRMEE